MTRRTITNCISILAALTALAALPTTTLAGYESLNSITGPVITDSDTEPYSSVSAITGPTGKERSHPAPPAGKFSTVSSIIGDDEPAAQPSTSVAADDGLQDVLIGLGATLLVIGVIGGASWITGRSRRRTAELGA